ncbi:MAG: TolC family protein, partial [Candidatus Methylomirabilales bacterium]
MRSKHRFIMVGFFVLTILGPLPILAQEKGRELSLPRAIEIALERSPLLQAARYQVEAAVAGVDRARASLLPKLDVRESFTRADNPVFAFSSKLNQGRFTQADFDVNRLNHPEATSNFQTNLSFAQPIYTGGKASIGFEQAKLHREATVQGFDRTRQEVIFQVAKAYYRVLLARADLEAVKSAIQAAEANRDLALARFKAGLVVESDVLSADVRLSSLKEQGIIAQNQLILAQAALNDVMGLPLEEPFEIKDRLKERPARSGRLEELERLALTRRPDYQRLGFEERALDLGVALARAEFLPILRATAGYELNHLSFAANGQDSWFVGIVLQWNLFNGLEDRAKVAEAKARFGEIHAQRVRMRSGIKLEVKDAFLTLKAAEERIGVAKRAVTQAEESLRIVKDRY